MRRLGIVLTFASLLLVPAATTLAADDSPRYLIYLHGRIVQLQQDARPVHPQWGAYELDEILAAFRDRGFDVMGEIRPKAASESASAQRVVEQVRGLLGSGVPGDHITVVGASAGGGIALKASARLQNPDVRFAILGNCLTNLVKQIETDEGKDLGGRLLSVREASDDVTRGCSPWRDVSGSFAAREIVIETGLSHGFLYRPLPDWLDPVVEWASEASRTIDVVPRNFVYFGLERSRISDEAFLTTDALVGAQLKYTWRELEPERDRYDLEQIIQDLSFLEEHGKKLFIQLQDISFVENRFNVPDYLLTDPVFGGGVELMVDGEKSEPIFEASVARRWDPNVRDRFAGLLEALGRELDGRIEGLNFAETSIGFGENAKLHPEGFTYRSYADGMMELMTAAGDAFKESEVVVYGNFMPAEWLPSDDRGYLRGIYEHAARIGIGVGGPDLLPHRRPQRNHCLQLIEAREENVVAGLAVQWGNLEDINPDTGKRVTVDELYRFAKERLRLDYIFWGIQEPYYSDEIIPFLREMEHSASE